MRFTSALTFCIALIFGCTKPPTNRPDPPPPPVLVAQAVKKTVPVQAQTIGTVKAGATVAIRPRVSGQLMEVFFKEGEYVTKNQPLLGIDPRPYQTTLEQAKSTVAKSQAVLAGAKLNLQRAELVNTGGAGAAIELDAARTAVANAEATVGVDQAAVDTAKLMLSFTTIVAPLDGRIGELLVNQGNLVDATAAVPLVVINQVSPLFVTFALPEAQLPAVAVARRLKPLTVQAYLRDGEPPIAGVLAFIDNAVNTGSGTVQLKAEFANRDRKLWPGQFVDVVLTIKDRPDSVVVPMAAVQSGQKGSYVYVVTGETVRLQAVTVAFETEGSAVIASGLSGDETVVVEGQLRLVDGIKVSVKKSPAGGAE